MSSTLVIDFLGGRPSFGIASMPARGWGDRWFGADDPVGEAPSAVYAGVERAQNDFGTREPHSTQ